VRKPQGLFNTATVDQHRGVDEMTLRRGSVPRAASPKPAAPKAPSWDWVDPSGDGPATLSQVMRRAEHRVASGELVRFRPLATGFSPLDEVMNGGIRRGELLVLGGSPGVGKTVLSLQIARNVVLADARHGALYICYEHDRTHLMSRLMCLESAELGMKESLLTMRALADVALSSENGDGLISRLCRFPRYIPVVRSMRSYANRLVLAKGSGRRSTLDTIRKWVEEFKSKSNLRLLVVIDYLQKIPVGRQELQPETEITTHLTQGLKEMAMSQEVAVIAIAASDRSGLASARMHLSDLRGSSALQYEADIGLVMSRKRDIVSREHVVYNLARADELSNWIVISVEKNRAGRQGIDMEYEIDAPHFRIVPKGRLVRERLVDGRLVLS